jgi:hypothetical protein
MIAKTMILITQALVPLVTSQGIIEEGHAQFIML